jgi:hypothetical protein
LNYSIFLFDTAGEDQTPPDEFIGPFTFSVNELGGFDTFSLTLDAELDDDLITLPEVNWRIDIYFGAEIAYRGWVETVRPSITRGQKVYQISGAGLMARIQEFAVNAAFITDPAVDVSAVFVWLAERYLEGDERLGSFTTNIPGDLGTEVNHLEMFGSNVRREFDRLAEIAQGGLIWGFDAPSGVNRLYVKEKNGTTGFTFTLGVDPLVEPLEMAEDLAEVINAVRVIGGQARVPNLLHNSSFEMPTFASTADLLISPATIVQEGWRAMPKEIDAFSVDWISDGLTSPDHPYHGTYFLRIFVSGANNETSNGKYQHCLALHPSEDHWVSAKVNTDYKIRFALRSPGEFRFRIDLQVRKGNDRIETREGTETTRSGNFWLPVEKVLQTTADDTAIRPILYLLSDGVLDVDAADMFRVLGSGNRDEYIPGEVYEFEFRSDDTDTLPGLSDDAQESIDRYGLRHAVVQTEEVHDAQTAIPWATGYLNNAAVPRKMGTVTLDPCLTHVRYVDGAGVALGRVSIEGARTTIPPVHPSRLTYRSTKAGDVALTMELGSRRPDPAIDGGSGGGGGGSIGPGASPGGVLGTARANSRSSFAGGDGSSEIRRQSRYGPNEDAPYTREWDEDRTTAQIRARTGGIGTIEVYNDEGNPMPPASGTLTELYRQNVRLVYPDEWEWASDTEIEIVDGKRPVGNEVVTLVHTAFLNATMNL